MVSSPFYICWWISLTNGTYNNVKLFNTGGTTWDGATATVVVSGNQVTQVDVTAGGSGYAGGET